MIAVNRNGVWFPSVLENLFFDNRPDFGTAMETFSSPAVNIIENLSNFVVEVAAPGMEKENFEIEVEKEYLTIKAKTTEEKEESTEDKDSRFRRREFNYKEFTRSFRLSEDINTEDIQAEYTNGVLRVSLPKKEEKKELKRMVEIS